MILGGGQCQKCKCIPCDPCTATCTEPHSGSAFEVVYTRYFEGAEAGNVTDGYLTASGDSDTSDPYDGMDGNGPWYQEVSGDFSINNTQTRFPCVLHVSFWRNHYTLGANTIPPPSSDLTVNKITVICTAGEVRVGDYVVSAGETYETGLTVPLVTGGGDQSANDPRSGIGTISLTPRCNEATFTVRARMEWNVKKRQHILYGTLRECYEDGSPCATACDGSPAPDVIYVEISNFELNPSSPYYVSSIAGVNGTYVLDRVANTCGLWIHSETGDGCAKLGSGMGQFVTDKEKMSLYIRTGYTGPSPASLPICIDPLYLYAGLSGEPRICGSGVIASGSSSGVAELRRLFGDGSSGFLGTETCTFDWKIEA